MFDFNDVDRAKSMVLCRWGYVDGTMSMVMVLSGYADFKKNEL